MKTIFGLVVALFIFTGCSSLSMNGVKTSDIQHTFKNGTIKTSQKVLIGKDKLSTLAYAGVGAAVGMGAGAALGNTKGGVIGALVGATAGTLTAMNTEVEAYKVEIKDLETENIVVAFLSENVEVGSIVEYIVRENNEVTNVNVVETFTMLKKRLDKEQREEQRKARYNRR